MDRTRRRQPGRQPLRGDPASARGEAAWRLASSAAAHRTRAFPPPPGTSLAWPSQPRVVPQSVRSRCLRALRHPLALDARRGRRALAGRGRTASRSAGDRDVVLDGGPTPAPSRHGSWPRPRAPSGRIRLQRRDRAHARPGTARNSRVEHSNRLHQDPPSSPRSHSSFVRSVCPAFRRTTRGPAKAGHYAPMESRSRNPVSSVSRSPELPVQDRDLGFAEPRGARFTTPRWARRSAAG